MSEIKDQIWITSRARMNAERRLLAYERAAQYSITILSLTLTITSIYSDDIGSVFSGFGKINTVISLVVFVISIFLCGFKFQEKASKYRDCYLKLQSLYRCGLADAELGNAYSAALENCFNHETRDYEDVIVEYDHKRNSPITNSHTKKEIRASRAMITSYYLRRMFLFSATYVLSTAALFCSICLIYISQH